MLGFGRLANVMLIPKSCKRQSALGFRNQWKPVQDGTIDGLPAAGTSRPCLNCWPWRANVVCEPSGMEACHDPNRADTTGAAGAEAFTNRLISRLGAGTNTITSYRAAR